MIRPTAESCLADWLDWLLNLHSQEIELGLTRVAQVAERLAVLRPAPYVITVAGTNGKGSSVAMLTSIMRAAGYKVGSYTSPHIFRFNERIRINGVEVDDQSIVQAFSQIESVRNEISLSYFEYTTLAALLLFKQASLDLVVLEVGLGGRLDAVNIVDADACLLTAIDVDHIDWLGSDREQIGYEKAGVMRAGALAVCSDPQPPKSVIKHAEKIEAKLSLLGRDYQYRLMDKQAWLLIDQNQQQTVWPRPALGGDFQCQNAAGVLALIHAQSAFKVSSQAIERGLKQANNPGRLQAIQRDKQAWLFDVAHNPQSVGALAGYLDQQRNEAKLEKAKTLAIFAGLNDKDLAPMVSQITPYIDGWLLVDLAVARATTLVELQEVLRLAGVSHEKSIAFDTMSKAMDWAKQSAYQQIVVYGSFITVSQALEKLDG